MCLGIPGRIVEILDEDLQLAKAEVSGVRRNINIGLVNGDDDTAALIVRWRARPVRAATE